MNENKQVVPLFGTAQTQQGQRVSSGLMRQMKRETESLAANTEIAAIREQAQAFLASQALTNVATLVNQAEALMQTSPAGQSMYEQIIRGYALGAGQRIARGL